MRHRVGQLDSVKAMPYEELEAMRMETDARLKVLEEQYWGKKEGAGVSASIREKYKSYSTAAESNADTPAESVKKGGTSILKKSSKAYGLTSSESLAKPKFGTSKPSFGGGTGAGRSRSKSTKKQRSPSPLHYTDPRQQIYEAKYEKYLANKKTKIDIDMKRQSMKPDEFDIFTKKGSPSKHGKRTKDRRDPVNPALSGKYNAEDLIDADLDRDILTEKELRKEQARRADPFGSLGVGNADKMNFFLLKWVFNAIKRESAEDDPKFKGQTYISKSDLIK